MRGAKVVDFCPARVGCADTRATVQQTPPMVVNFFEQAKVDAPKIAERVKEDITLFRELRAMKKTRKRAASVATMDAAAEE